MEEKGNHVRFLKLPGFIQAPAHLFRCFVLFPHQREAYYTFRKQPAGSAVDASGGAPSASVVQQVCQARGRSPHYIRVQKTVYCIASALATCGVFVVIGEVASSRDGRLLQRSFADSTRPQNIDVWPNGVVVYLEPPAFHTEPKNRISRAASVAI